MPALVALPLALMGVSCLLTLVWLLQLRTRNAGLVDAVWSWSLGGVAVLYALLGSAPEALRGCLGLLGGLWGLRLGTHLLIRNHGRPEDGRYARLRAAWSHRANWRMFWLFQLQALFVALLSLGFLVIAWRPSLPPPPAFALAAAIWLLAVVGESVADAQLAAFKRNPDHHGRVCRHGLWRYSRHPNYFFECVHWAAYLPLAFGAPYGWVALIPPAVMAFLLLRMSGIPLTEAQAAASRPEYAEYMRSTSAFFPWPPRRSRRDAAD